MNGKKKRLGGIEWRIVIFDITLCLYPFTNHVCCALSGDFFEIEFMVIFKSTLGILVKISSFSKNAKPKIPRMASAFRGFLTLLIFARHFNVLRFDLFGDII